jgi:hypothetical protein
VAPSFRSPFRRDTPPDPDPDLDPDPEPAEAGARGDEVTSGDEWIEYELHEWALEPRRMLAQLLSTDTVPHSWQGTTLLVHEVHEAAVDALIEEVELATNQRIEPGEPVVAFEMEGWSSELLAQLLARLGGAGVPHEIDEDGDLIVREDDEEQVEMVIEDLIARSDDAGRDELDGLDVNSLLSDLFVACDRLRRDVSDAAGVVGAVRHGRRLTQVRTPFGFAGQSWRALRDRADELVEMLEGGEADDDEIRAHARELRDALQLLI